MANLDIKILLQANNIKQYEVAERMGVSEPYISQILRRELKGSLRERVITTIETMISERRWSNAKD